MHKRFFIVSGHQVQEVETLGPHGRLRDINEEAKHGGSQLGLDEARIEAVVLEVQKKFIKQRVLAKTSAQCEDEHAAGRHAAYRVP